MKVELTRTELLALVKGQPPYYSEFDNPLVIKAKHSYSDQYGRTEWYNLRDLTDDELWQLYVICRDSWN